MVKLRQWCAHNGHEIVGEYVDREDGNRTSRSEFQRLFIDVRRSRFELVLFWSLDRFTREGVGPTLDYLQRLDREEVAFRSYTEEYIDSAGLFKDAIISILTTLAQQETVRQSERVLAGLKRAKAKGKQLGRPALSKTKIAAIHELRKTLSIRAVADKLGISRSVVGKYSP